jgi:hypothetical protein
LRFFGAKPGHRKDTREEGAPDIGEGIGNGREWSLLGLGSATDKGNGEGLVRHRVDILWHDVGHPEDRRKNTCVGIIAANRDRDEADILAVRSAACKAMCGHIERRGDLAWIDVFQRDAGNLKWMRTRSAPRASARTAQAATNGRA